MFRTARAGTFGYSSVLLSRLMATPGAVREGRRVLSAYGLRDGTRIWIITEADRSVTTILLPEEY